MMLVTPCPTDCELRHRQRSPFALACARWVARLAPHEVGRRKRLWLAHPGVPRPTTV